MGKKCKCPPAGAPEWVMTFGDMMSLLLTFFILLAALSEIKKEDVYQSIVEQVQQSFGIHGGGAKIPTNDPPEQSLIQLLTKMYRDQMKKPQDAHQDDPGVEGKQMRVQKVTPGKQFAVGGRIEFEPGSADLSDVARGRLDQIAGLIRGKNNKVTLKGHSVPGELVDGQAYDDVDALSYARAKAVKNYLVSEQARIRKERLVVVAAGDSEPLVLRQYTAEGQRPNRRVEIVVDERTVADYTHAGKSLQEPNE